MNEKKKVMVKETINDDEVLECPYCSKFSVESRGNLRLATVGVAARHEDEEFREVYVDTTSGHHADTPVRTPIGKTVGEGRRSRVALIFSCENCCGEHALVLTQHKGDTIVEWVVSRTPLESP